MADASNEQKKQFNKLKHGLEESREIILLLNSVLKWEKSFYPGITFGVISLAFLILWSLDLSLLTLVSLIALIGSVLDYVFPIISKAVFKPENWTGVKEKSFEDACNEILNIKSKACGLLKYLFTNEEKNIVKYIITWVTLIVLAYIGSAIDNLLLSYLATLVAALSPGLVRQEAIRSIIDKLLNQAKGIKDKAVKKN